MYKSKQKAPFFIAIQCVLLLLTCTQLLANQVDPIEKAIHKKLHKHHYWHTLLHYKQGITGTTSEITSDEFFLSERGKTSAGAELEANITKMFIEKDESVISRFPARYKWLASELDLDIEPQLFSDRYKRYSLAVEKLSSCTLIFASDYVGAPESVYGHTLIRLDGENGSLLLGQTINYAAHTGKASPVEFVLKGIAGGFPGNYSVQPYYKKRAQYSYKESRDIYEYKLNIDKERLFLMMDHLYEVDAVIAPYYFFSANCAYSIFYLIDAAYKSERLVPQLKPWVIPLDTIHILKRHNLLRPSDYKPSSGTSINAYAKNMTKSEVDKAIAIAEKRLDSQAVANDPKLSREQKGRIFDLALEYYHFKTFPTLKTREDLDALKKRSIALARHRAKLGKLSYPKISRDDPLLGHSPFLVESAAGYSYTRAHTFIKVRPSYHELSDHHYGYAFGGEIVFPSITIAADPLHDRWYESAYIEDITIGKITSIKERSHVQKPLSWKFMIGAGYDRPLSDRFEGRVEYKLGGAWKITSGTWYYLMGGIRPQLSAEPNIAPAAEAGLIMNYSRHFKYNLSSEYRRNLLAKQENFSKISGEAIAAPVSTIAFSLGYSLGIVNTSAYHQTIASVKFYF